MGLLMLDDDYLGGAVRVPSENVQVGQLVSSKAGRDEDRFYLIWKLVDDSFVDVVDGEVRGVQNPKRKNLKHLQTFNQYSSKVTVDATNGITNPDIRNELSELRSRL